MKVENTLSYKLNNQVLEIMSKVREHYPDTKTVIMNLKSISKELNDLTIKTINREEISNGNSTHS
jgi:Trm5-related predicted tRNA methylase